MSHSDVRGRGRAFTLLELVVVLALLALVVGMVGLDQAERQRRSARALVMRDLGVLRDALVRFRADTGFLPRQGPFALVADGGEVPLPAEGRAWFDSPANLTQLVAPPLPPGAPLASWDPDRRRGWRGPYLRGTVARTPGRGAQLLGSPRLPALPALVDASAGAKGRPYLLLELDRPARARVLAAGPDGRYGSPDDPSLFLFR